MLKLFRNKNVTKAVLWGLLILILPAFVLWGSGSLGRSEKKGPTYVGAIENKKVSFENFAQSLTSIRCQIILNYYGTPKSLESLLKNKAFIGKLAWDRLILIKKAQAARMKVPDKDVVKFISSHPIFLRDGRFDSRAYEYFLKNSLGLYPRTFEELVRENLMIQKLTDKITKDITITDAEVMKSYGEFNSRFKISYIFVPSAAFMDKEQVITDSEMRKFYEEHKQDFIAQIKDAEGKEASRRTATFDETKDNIKKFLIEAKARSLALESAGKTYEELRGLMDDKKLSFESAASRLGFKPQESQPFARSDKLEGLGEMGWAAAAAAELKKDEVSKPVEAGAGALIFRVTQTLPFDEEAFKKERGDFTKKALVDKKNLYTEEWITKLEKDAELNIDLGDYEKYYK